MVFNTGLIVCVLLAVGGLAFVDPWYGFSAFGGAVLAALVVLPRRRAAPVANGIERARETVDGLYSTRHMGGHLPVEERHASQVELETARYMGVEGWEEEMLS
jgi:hypothetical protein